MNNRSKSRALCVAASLALLTVAPASAFAQSNPFPDSGGATPGGDTRDPFAERPSGERAATGRLARQRRGSREAAPAAPTPAEHMAAAQAFLSSRNINCQVTEANFLGQTEDGSKLYETACANDFGYMSLVSETAPMALDCMEVAISQERALAADPAAQLGPKCELPANNNFLTVLTHYAAQAQLPCTVDEATIIGKRDDVNVYEIGCAGTDGYQLIKQGAGWSSQPCLELASANVTCSYTTRDEQIATVKTWLAGSEAAACDITNVRYMGGNANGAFYEAACNGADGLIARLNTDKAVQQVYPCAEAAQIGGGCKLTAGAPQGTNG